MEKGNSAIDRAAEILKGNPDMKYYQAMELAKGEKDEMDRGRISGLSKVTGEGGE